MSEKSTSSFKPIVCALLIALTGCAAPSTTHGIPNLGLVRAGVWRGGQPNSEGWAWLKSEGITNVVKLNTGDDSEARRLGMNVHRIPISFCQQTIGEPSSEQVVEVLTLLRQPGTFVHCTHGQDRTGLMVALERVASERWTESKAESEMIDHGFHIWLRGLYWAWEDYNSLRFANE